MNRLSNKGQSLVIFIVFIPFLIMIGTYVVDMSYAKYNANKLDETTKMIIRYGLNHLDEDPYSDMVDLIYQNDDDVDNYSIEIDNDTKTIKMSVQKASRGFFGSIIGKDIYNERSSYVGYIENEKIIIEEVEK